MLRPRAPLKSVMLMVEKMLSHQEEISLRFTIYDYTEKIMYNNVPCYRNSFIRKNTVMHCFINFPYSNELHCHSIIETFQRTAWVLSNRYQSRNIDKLKTVFWDKTDLSYSVSNSPIKKYLSKNFRY